MIHYYVYSSQFRENQYPVYCIANQNPELEDDWKDKSCRKNLIGIFKTYAEAVKNLKESVSDFSEYEELDDSAIHGETVFVHK